jgi:hypothetical protein
MIYAPLGVEEVILRNRLLKEPVELAEMVT